MTWDGTISNPTTLDLTMSKTARIAEAIESAGGSVLQIKVDGANPNFTLIDMTIRINAPSRLNLRRVTAVNDDEPAGS